MIHLVIGGARRTGRVLAVVERGDLHALVDRQSKQKLCPQPRKPTASSATSSVQIPQAIVLAPPARCAERERRRSARPPISPSSAEVKEPAAASASPARPALKPIAVSWSTCA